MCRKLSKLFHKHGKLILIIEVLLFYLALLSLVQISNNHTERVIVGQENLAKTKGFTYISNAVANGDSIVMNGRDKTCIAGVQVDLDGIYGFRVVSDIQYSKDKNALLAFDLYNYEEDFDDDRCQFTRTVVSGENHIDQIIYVIDKHPDKAYLRIFGDFNESFAVKNIGIYTVKKDGSIPVSVIISVAVCILLGVLFLLELIFKIYIKRTKKYSESNFLD